MGAGEPLVTRILRDRYVWNANRPQSAIRAWGRVGVKTTSQKNDVIIHLRRRVSVSDFGRAGVAQHAQNAALRAGLPEESRHRKLLI